MAFLVALLLALFVVEPPASYVVLAAGALVEAIEVWFWWWFSRRRQPTVGVETLVGRSATVVTACSPRGQVRVGGEIWQARCDGGADAGDEVRVVEVRGLELVVEG